jgi:L-threonylcarbamoyladenylate synthase
MSYVSLSELVTGALSRQALISFPTDTVPALAAHPVAAPLIYEAKQRQWDKPLILMAAEIDDFWEYIQGSAAEQACWRSLMQHYFPGALTLVLPASPRVPLAMHPESPDTIGVRVPDHDLARLILRQTGPLATTSANRSGQPALLSMEAIAAKFPEVLQLSEQALLELSVDPSGWPASGVPSTVIQWCDGGWRLLRQGAVILPSDWLQP